MLLKLKNFSGFSLPEEVIKFVLQSIDLQHSPTGALHMEA
jgi:hypothetical protein